AAQKFIVARKPRWQDMKPSQLGKNVLVNKVVAGYIGIAHLRSGGHTDSGAKEMATSSDQHLRLTTLNRFDQTFGTHLCNVRIVGHVKGLVGNILSPAIRKTER